MMPGHAGGRDQPPPTRPQVPVGQQQRRQDDAQGDRCHRVEVADHGVQLRGPAATGDARRLAGRPREPSVWSGRRPARRPPQPADGVGRPHPAKDQPDGGEGDRVDGAGGQHPQGEGADHRHRKHQTGGRSPKVASHIPQESTVLRWRSIALSRRGLGLVQRRIVQQRYGTDTACRSYGSTIYQQRTLSCR
jgi:hypothetical protein